MELSMLHYYFLRSLEKEIPFQIKSKITIDKNFAYASSNFLNLGYYYKVLNIIKKDKYNLSEKLHDEAYFYPYIYDNIILAKYKNNYRHLFFIYGNIASYTLDKYLKPYLEAFVTKKRSYYKIANMVDYYYSYKNEKIDLSKTLLTKIFDYDTLYTEEINNYINKPIQKNLKFFACKNYYLKSARVKNFIDSSFTKNNGFIVVAKFMDFAKILEKNKKKLKDFKYTKKVDTTILNLSHCPILVNNIETNDSIDDVISKAYNYAKSIIQAINNYIFFGNTKDFKEITGLSLIEDAKNEEKNQATA